MVNHGSQAIAALVTVFPALRYGADPVSVVEDETAWRARPAVRSRSSEPKIVVTRWRALDQQTREVSAQTPDDEHLVSIVLRNENIRISVGGRILHDGPVMPGTVQVTEPGVPARCLFRGPYDVLHLHVPNALIAKLGGEASVSEAAPLHSGPALTQDPVVERLARALVTADEVAGPCGQLYVECIATAIVTRLLASTRRVQGSGRAKVAELARWRLRRVTEYVDENLAESVSLADLAAAAGLTRMHFAAQFRAATGLPPHEYLLRRRIERAQEMLAEDREALVDIALSVGFQTQSHFTSVFKRFVGQPPRAWRQRHCDKSRCGNHNGDWRTDEAVRPLAAA
jgi:AraC family transcriptional regulator